MPVIGRSTRLAAASRRCRSCRSGLTTIPTDQRKNPGRHPGQPANLLNMKDGHAQSWTRGSTSSACTETDRTGGSGGQSSAQQGLSETRGSGHATRTHVGNDDLALRAQRNTDGGKVRHRGHGMPSRRSRAGWRSASERARKRTENQPETGATDWLATGKSTEDRTREGSHNCAKSWTTAWTDHLNH